jgi:hypothetical protein
MMVVTGDRRWRRNGVYGEKHDLENVHL